MTRLVARFLLAAIVFLSAACAPAATPPAGQTATGSAPAVAEKQPASAKPAVAGQVARVEVLRLPSADYGSPTPFGYSRGPGYCRMSFIFDTLVWKDSTGSFIPWLAESWTKSDDGLTWTFRLRDGVKFHDGKPLTSDDVAFTYQYLTKHSWSPTLPDILKRVEATDARTVRFTLSKPYAPFLGTIVGPAPIVPKHIWEKVDDPRKYNAPDAWIGSGPYVLKSYNKAEGSYLYEAFDDFWLGKPFVKRLELVPVGDEALALKQGQVHAGSTAGITSGTGEDLLRAFRSDPRFATLDAVGEWNLVLNFNLSRGKPYDDKSFRQAVAHALDLQKMVDQVLFGAGRPGTPGYLPESNPWKNPKTGPYPYDPARAKQLLREAGYVDKDGDGVLEGPDGRPLKIQLLYSGELSSPRPAEMIKGWLAEVGVEIQLKAVDRATLDAMTADGQYDLAITGYGGLGGDPDQMRTTFWSQSKSKSFGRVFGYRNERFDELAVKQLSVSDEATRRQMIYEMQEVLYADVPVIPLYYPDSSFTFDRTVFDAWYFTPGGIGSGVPMTWNKHAFVTGEMAGLKIRGS